jgi:hypothetical protein
MRLPFNLSGGLLALMLLGGICSCADEGAAGDPGGDADTDADTDSDTDADADSDSDADTDVDTDVDTDSDSDTDVDTDMDTDSDADSDTDTDADTDADTDTGTGAAITDTVASVSAGSDDAEELISGGGDYSIGHVAVTSSDLEMVDDSGWHGGDQLIGLRFPGLAVPQGSTIESAFVRLTADGSDSGATSLTLSAQAANNALAFTAATNDISSRMQTAASVDWSSVGAWTDGAQYDSPDIAALVQEVVNRPGWASGNALAIFVEGSGLRTAYSYDGDPAAGAELHVSYSAAEPDTDTDTGTDTDTAINPVLCDDEPVITYASSGLPLMEMNPGAPIALFVDYDGGPYYSSSLGYFDHTGYNRSGSVDTFDAEEQADVIASMIHMGHYYAMFDVNVTNDEAVKDASVAWGWIVITEEVSGGQASLSSTAIGTNPYARARCGASTVRIEDGDKSRRIAHELGHNFTLEHSGVWEGDTFYKWEDWPDWDYVYGPIMGGGGYGDRNGWSYGHHSGDPDTMQDTMEIIRQRVIDVGGSATGWRVDDFTDDDPAPMCDGGTHVYRIGILGDPDDQDIFELVWEGGDLLIDAFAPDVSAALVTVDLLDGDTVIGGLGVNSGVAAGTYHLRVQSEGGYAEIGTYQLTAEVAP